tara:strand:+ start:157 stop:411 length:255 start_codon:yes stop_codon:yes gene_type:complete
MKEAHITVKNITNKQWVNLLLELNLVSGAWKRYGPEIKIKTKNFDRIIKWGQKINGEDNDNTNLVIRWNPRKRKIRTSQRNART